jgi:hypothetical protein
MGGVNGGVYTNTVYSSTDGINWNILQSTNAFTARKDASLLVHAGNMFLVGGNNGADMLTVFYSPDGINWTPRGPTLPAARSLMAACVYAGKMWFVGGSASTTVYASTDGLTFTIPSVNYGGGALTAAQLVGAPTPTATSAINAPTMWLIGGTSGTPRSNIYRATLNVAAPASIAIGTGGLVTDQFQFETQNAGAYLILKNTTDAWVYWGGALTKITDPNYPTSTVGGIVNVDDYLFVMGSDGTVFGSDLSNPFHWSALNFITADFVSDTGIMVVKYLQYVLTLKSRSFQIFYDAGRFPGSPLLPNIGSNTNIGCAHAGSVVKMMNTVIFMAQSNTAGRYIAMMDGQMARPISDDNVNRVLGSWNGATSLFAFGCKWNGDDIYVLTNEDLPAPSGTAFTIIYNFTSQEWSFLEDALGVTNILPGINYVTDGITDYLQAFDGNGKIYKVDPLVYTDDGVAFSVIGYTPKLDMGTDNRKFCTSIAPIADRRCKIPPNLLIIDVSDNDLQTFTTVGTVDLSSEFNPLTRAGSFFRRQHRWTHAFDNPLRLESLELDIVGEEKK